MTSNNNMINTIAIKKMNKKNSEDEEELGEKQRMAKIN